MVGIVVGAFSLFSLFLAIPSGGLTDTLGVKHMLLIGVVCSVISAAVLLWATSPLALIISQVLGGLAFQLHVVPSQTFVSQIPDASDRESGFGYLTFGAALGQTIGPFLGGVLASVYGYRGAFIAALVASTAGFAVLVLREPRGGKTSRSYHVMEDLGRAGSLLANRQMVTVLTVSLVMIFAAGLRTSFLPVLLRDRGLSETFVGLLISIFGGTSTFVRPFVGRLLARFRRRDLLLFAMATAIFSVTAAPLLSSRIALALTLGAFGIGFGLTQPLSMVMVADLTTPSHAGVAMGLRFTAMTVATLLGPVVLGVVVGEFGLEASFFATAALVGVTAATILGPGGQHLPRRREEQHAGAYND